MKSSGQVLAVLVEVAETQHGAFTRAQAALRGIGPRPLATLRRNGVIIEGFAGVLLLAGAPRSWEQRVSAALLWAGPAVPASHRTAARLHGLDGFDRETNIDVTVPYGRRPDRKSVV